MRQDLSTRPPSRLGHYRWTPGTLLLIIRRATISPTYTDICAAARIAPSTLRRWLEKSAKGALGSGDGFDVKMDGEIRRFHEWFKDACESCLDQVENAAFEYSLGYKKIGTYRGRVVYKDDPERVALGATPGTFAAWERDAHGNPVPETWREQDPEMIRWLLERRRPEKYGNRQSIDVTHRGGVLVVGAKLGAAELEKRFGGVQEPQDVIFEEVEDEQGTENE